MHADGQQVGEGRIERSIPYLISLDETLDVGTGRFVGASGSLAETGWFDPDTGYMEVTGVGSIIYDASRRASNG